MDPTVCPLLLLLVLLVLLLLFLLHQLLLDDLLLHLIPCSVCPAPPSLSLSSLPLQAIYGGDLEVLELLSSTKGVDIHSLNNFGCGAAFWAAAAGNVDTCRSQSFSSSSSCSSSSPPACRWLLAKGIDFTLVNGAGHAAVHKVGGRATRAATASQPCLHRQHGEVTGKHWSGCCWTHKGRGSCTRSFPPSLCNLDACPLSCGCKQRMGETLCRRPA